MFSNYFKSFSNSIKLYRNQLKLNQKELSEKLKMNYRHFQSVEAGKVDVKLSTVLQLANALGKPACFLLETQTSPPLKKMGICCPAEILNIINLGVQVNDLNGLILYCNKKHAEILGLKPEDINFKKYIWDFMPDEEQINNLRTYFNFLIDNQPAPTPYFTKNKTIQGEVIPLKIDWNYIFDENQKLTGFISLTSFHPSW